MAKLLRMLLLGLLVTSVLAGCGETTTDTGTASPATSIAPSVAAGEAAASTAAASTVAAPEASMGTSAEAAASGTTADVTLPDVDPSAVSGDVITAGSSTVFPLSQRMAERFREEGYGGTVTVDSIGSGAGFERFCAAKESDIANASRPIEQDEIDACGADRVPLEFRVGTDAIVVAVSAENDFLGELTLEQLQQVFSTATTWNEIDPSFPSEPIQRFIPGTDSGTFDYFAEAVFDENAEPLLQAQNLQQSEDDNVLVQGVTGSPYAIGFFGFAYFQENEERLKATAIDGVEPNAETAENNSYPLSRPLFIYSAASIMQEKPQVADFLNFYLTNVNDEIEEAGYFPASAEALTTAKQRWLDAVGQ